MITTLRKSGKAEGFTLVELVTVVVIVGILGAVAVPRLLDNEEFSQRGYIDEVASSLRYAQRIAIASRCEVSFAINAQNYSASQRSNEARCDSKTGAWTTPVRRADGSTVSGRAPVGISMSPSWTIVFDENGAVVGSLPSNFSVGPFTMSVNSAGNVAVYP